MIGLSTENFGIRCTSENCIIEGRPCADIPIIIVPGNTVDADTSDYLRQQVIENTWKPKTSRTHAEAILHCMKYAYSIRRPFLMMRDTDLRKWINAQRKSGVSENVITQRVAAVYRFFRWAEANGRTYGAVDLHGRDALAAPRITSDVVETKRKGSKNKRIKYQAKVSPKSVPDELQPTPTHDDVTALLVEGVHSFGEAVGERNSLLIRWAAHSGVRRFEWGALQVEQLPSLKKVVQARTLRNSLEIKLVITKNSRQRVISVLPDLVEDTWEYIEGERKAIVERFMVKRPEEPPPKEIFLSKKTGRALVDKAITNIYTKLFFRAGVEGHGHRLRATHLAYLFEATLDAEEARLVSLGRPRSEVDHELVLRIVADQAGQKSVHSLRPYLTLARKRRRNRAEVEEAVTLEQKIASDRAEVAVVEAKIALKNAELEALRHEIADLENRRSRNGNS